MSRVQIPSPTPTISQLDIGISSFHRCFGRRCSNLSRALLEVFRIDWPSSFTQQLGVALEHCRYIRVIFPENFFANGERALLQFDRVVVLLLDLLELRQVHEA